MNNLTFDQPVPRQLVHRRSTSEVMSTSFVTLAPDRFDVGLQWPRRHSLYSTMPLNSALAAEAIRQVTIYLCHAAYDVPLALR